MKDLLVLCFGEKSVLRNCVILGAQRREDTSIELGLTPVPETPPGCQMDLFLESESHKTNKTSDKPLVQWQEHQPKNLIIEDL